MNSYTEHPEDYIETVTLHIMVKDKPPYTKESEIYRIDKILSPSDIVEIRGLIASHENENAFGGHGFIQAGPLRIWMTGALKFIGPPERHPENKYNNNLG